MSSVNAAAAATNNDVHALAVQTEALKIANDTPASLSSSSSVALDAPKEVRAVSDSLAIARNYGNMRVIIADGMPRIRQVTKDEISPDTVVTAVDFPPIVIDDLQSMIKTVLTNYPHATRLRLPRLTLQKDTCSLFAPLKPHSLDLTACLPHRSDLDHEGLPKAEVAGLAVLKETLQEITFGSFESYEAMRWAPHNVRDRTMKEEQMYFLDWTNARKNSAEDPNKWIASPPEPIWYTLKIIVATVPNLRFFSNTFFPMNFPGKHYVFEEVGKLTKLERLLLSFNVGNGDGDYMCAFDSRKPYEKDMGLLSKKDLDYLKGLTQLKSLTLTSYRGGCERTTKELITQLVEQFPLLEELSLPILSLQQVGLSPFCKLKHLRSIDLLTYMFISDINTLWDELAAIPSLERVRLHVSPEVSRTDCKALSKLSSLHTLILTAPPRDGNKPVFEDSFQRALRETLPNCTIILNGMTLPKAGSDKLESKTGH